MNPTTNHDYRTFRFTEADIDRTFGDSCARQIISTTAFRRLAAIHFLGSIDFLLNGSRYGVENRHTRYEHSLAVAGLARRFCDAKDLPARESEVVVIAGLLHDIGHAPLSHSLEPAFKNIFDIDHHTVGEKIIRGEVKIGVRLSQALQRCDVNNFEIMAIISGVGQGAGRELFSRSINVDTIEGVLRSASYLYRKGIVQDPAAVIDAFTSLGRQSHDKLDEFWLMKDKVYSELIQSSKGLMADYICKRYMEKNSNKFQRSYYYGTEKELKKDHAELFSALEHFGRDNILPPVIKNGEAFTYSKRKFHIDNSVELRSYADVDRRYLQTKTKVERQIKKTGGEDAHSIRKYPESKGLF